MAVALAAFDVLGHILKSHYAKLDAEPKEAIFRAILAAAKRLLGRVFSDLYGSSRRNCRSAHYSDRLQKSQMATWGH